LRIYEAVAVDTVGHGFLHVHRLPGRYRWWVQSRARGLHCTTRLCIMMRIGAWSRSHAPCNDVLRGRGALDSGHTDWYRKTTGHDPSLRWSLRRDFVPRFWAPGPDRRGGFEPTALRDPTRSLGFWLELLFLAFFVDESSNSRFVERQSRGILVFDIVLLTKKPCVPRHKR
jgi:hypothetical protein